MITYVLLEEIQNDIATLENSLIVSLETIHAIAI